MLFVWLFLGIVLLWVVKSVQILSPKEMAVLLFLGKPIGFCNSGIHFVPFLLYSLVKRPKKMFNLDYVAREVITKKGTYNGVKYGAQALKVDAVAYLSLPRGITENEGNLIKIVESDVPYDDEGLKNWTEDSVVGSLRAVFADMTWMQAIEKIEELKKETEKKFQDADGALVKVGFDSRDLKLVIKEVKLPKELEESLVGPDRERLKMNAADFIAKRQAKEWVGMVVESYAYVKGKSVKKAQKEIDSNEEIQREFFDYAKMVNLRLEEANRGTVMHVVVDGGAGDKKSSQSSFLENLTKNIIEILTVSQKMSEKSKESLINTDQKDKEEAKEEAKEEVEIEEERPLSPEGQRIYKNVKKTLKNRKRKK